MTPFEIFMRSFFAFLAVLVIARFLGKKQISQLTFFDYIVAITIGSITTAVTIDDKMGFLDGVVGVLPWVAVPLLFDFISQKSYWFRRLIDGRPSVIIQNGKILEKELKKAKMTLSDMMQLLREQQVFNVADVEFAVLEMNGKISVMKKKKGLESLTPQVAGIPVENEREPRLVIMDGHVMDGTLQDMGYTRQWLLGEISKQGATDFKDVFLAQVDGKGTVWADLYHDRLKQPELQARSLVAASLKKMQADLERFALETENSEAKAMYQQEAEELKQLFNRISPYLKRN